MKNMNNTIYIKKNMIALKTIHSTKLNIGRNNKIIGPIFNQPLFFNIILLS